MKILAIDIGGTAIKTGLFINETPVAFDEFPTGAQSGARLMADRVCSYIKEKKPDAVGICTSGQVNPTDGSIAFATEAIPQYTGFPLLAYIRNNTGLSVIVENDVNSAAIGEAFFGAAENLSDFLCLAYGTGIGGALFINGNLYRGFTGVAGEFGHIITHKDGIPCSCGQKGCYEMYASTSALLRRAKEELGCSITGRELFAERKNPAIRHLLSEWACEAAVGLVTLTHIFNPPALIIGGGFVSQPEIAEYIMNEYYPRLIPSFRETKILCARLGNRAGIYGAYILAKMQLKNQHS